MQIDNDYEKYKDIDLDNTAGIKRIKHPLIQRLQENAKAENKLDSKAIDEDILQWITKQDQSTKQYINNMIRNFMNFKTA